MRTKIISLFAFIACGCDVNSQEISAANKACEPHGGVVMYRPQVGNISYNALCADGVNVSGDARP